MDRLDVELEGRVAAEYTLAELALEWLQLHVNTLGMVFQVGNGLESLATVWVSALERPDIGRVGQEMVFEVLLLLERLQTACVRTLELALVAFHVPVELALGNKLAITANWAFVL